MCELPHLLHEMCEKQLNKNLGGGVFVKMYLTCTIKLKSPNWGYCVERQTVPVDKIFKIFW